MDSCRIAASSLSVVVMPQFCSSTRMSFWSKSRSSASSTVIRPAYWNAIKLPGGAPRDSSTKRRSAPVRISSHRVCRSRSSCRSCRSSISRISQSSAAEGIAKSAAPAFRRRMRYLSIELPGMLSSSASASAVLPKPHGALKKSTRSCCRNR